MGQTVLITGASAGIGYELALMFAKDGYNLVLVARNELTLQQIAEELKKSYGVAVRVIVKDISYPSAPTEIFEELQRDSVQIDILINNAGFGSYGPFHQSEIKTELAILQVNISALTHLCGLFLPMMVQRGSGKIMNVASTAAFQAGPLMAVYYASKAFVLSFTEALANELQHTGVTVTALCPGPTATGFQARAHQKESKLVREKVMNAKIVAKAGYRGLLNKQTVVIPGIKNRLLVGAVRFLPRKLVTTIIRNIQERRK